MPPDNSQAQFTILLVVTFIGTSGFIIVTSMVADIVEETELHAGRRSEGLLLANDRFLRKIKRRNGDRGSRVASGAGRLSPARRSGDIEPASNAPACVCQLAALGCSQPSWRQACCCSIGSIGGRTKPILPCSSLGELHPAFDVSLRLEGRSRCGRAR